MSIMSTITKEWITVAEAAEKIGCAPRTVLRLVEAEKIRKHELNPRLYLVHVDDVENEAKRTASTGRPRGS